MRMRMRTEGLELRRPTAHHHSSPTAPPLPPALLEVQRVEGMTRRSVCVCVGGCRLLCAHPLMLARWAARMPVCACITLLVPFFSCCLSPSPCVCVCAVPSGRYPAPACTCIACEQCERERGGGGRKVGHSTTRTRTHTHTRQAQGEGSVNQLNTTYSRTTATKRTTQLKTLLAGTIS